MVLGKLGNYFPFGGVPIFEPIFRGELFSFRGEGIFIYRIILPKKHIGKKKQNTKKNTHRVPFPDFLPKKNATKTEITNSKWHIGTMTIRRNDRSTWALHRWFGSHSPETTEVLGSGWVVPLHHGFPLGLFGRARGATPYMGTSLPVIMSTWHLLCIDDCKLLSIYSNFTLHSKLDSFDLSFIDSRYVNGCPWGVVGEVKEELCTLYIARPRKEWATR